MKKPPLCWSFWHVPLHGLQAVGRDDSGSCIMYTSLVFTVFVYQQFLYGAHSSDTEIVDSFSVWLLLQRLFLQVRVLLVFLVFACSLSCITCRLSCITCSGVCCNNSFSVWLLLQRLFLQELRKSLPECYLNRGTPTLHTAPPLPSCLAKPSAKELLSPPVPTKQSLVWIVAGHTEHRDNPAIKVSHR